MGVKPIVTASGFGDTFWRFVGHARFHRRVRGGRRGRGAAQGGADDTSRRACRNLIRSGTRLSTRYCRTQAEWDEAGEGARRFFRRARKTARRATAR